MIASGVGYIQPHALDELWFHTGTACNLDCPFCLEGSRPGDNRLQRITLGDVRPLMDAAVGLNVRQFSFTGGEPFVVKDMVAILEYAASLRPCLVLTNGTAPVVRRLTQIRRLAGSAHPIAFRVSFDFADEARHDAGRGAGNFRLALQGLRALHKGKAYPGEHDAIIGADLWDRVHAILQESPRKRGSAFHHDIGAVGERLDDLMRVAGMQHHGRRITPAHIGFRWNLSFAHHHPQRLMLGEAAIG